MKAGSVLALFAGVAATPSFAGSLAGDCLSGPDCRPGVVVTPSQAHFDDVLVSIKQPMGHLRSVDYRRSPHVSVTRIHGQGEVPHESDFPSSFSGGCHPESLTYCKAGGVAPAPAPVAAPVAQPFVAPPVFAAPVHARPVVAAPAPAPVPTLRQWTASYDDNPARFTPRQYGSLDFVPGIAHVPSSWVDRDPGRAQAALNASGGGVAPGPQSGLQRIPDDTPGPLMPIGQLQGPAPVQPGSIVQPGPASHGPTREVFVGQQVVSQQVVSQQVSAPVQFAAPLQAPAVQAPVMAQPIFNAPAFNAPVPGRAGPPLEVAPGVYGSSVGADGTYWEKVSGPTMMGDTVATQVICKRALPTQTVNPVVGVPVPVPYPVDECGPNHVSGHQPQFHAPVQGPVQHAPVQHAPVHHAPAYQTHGLAGGVWTQ